jgi:hypothetical protein
MKRYTATAIFVIFSIPFFHLFPIQDARSEDTGLTFGGFQWNGAIELGYRFTDIDGSKNRYKETVNLMEGLRLFDFSLLGRNLNPGTGVVDYFNLTGRNIADPFPSARLEVRKNKTYDFVTSFNQYKYYSNREDNGYLTDNHDFSTKFSNFLTNLSVFPKDDIKLNFAYRHWGRDGDIGVPRLNTPVAFPQDLDEGLNEYTISADFPIGGWDFNIKESYWNYHNDNKINAPVFFEKRNENTNTFVSTVKAHTRFGERWDFDTALVYAHSNGWSSLNTAPEFTVQSGKSQVENDTYVAELGLSYQIIKPLIFHIDYRFHTFDQDGSHTTDILLLDRFLSPDLQSHPDTNTSLTAHTGTLQLEWLPLNNLVLRGGYLFQYRHIEGEAFYTDQMAPFAGGEDPTDTKQWTNGWVGSIDWKPYKFLSIFGEYKGSNTNDPYTWISPDNTNVAKVRIKYDTPIDRLTLKGNYSWRRRTNPDQSYRVDAQDFTFAANYVPSFLTNLSVDASFTYEKILDKKDIFNLDFGTRAFQTFFFNSSAYIYAGGISYEGIYKGLGARIYGSYAKTLTENPQRYLDGSFSIFYKNKWLIPALTWERTYLHDHVNRNDSFDADLLTFSLRKEF